MEAQYIREAADKVKDSGAMFPAQIAEQYRKIQAGEVSPYASFEEIQAPAPSFPIATVSKGLGIAAGVAIGIKAAMVGVAAIFAFLEANALACGAGVAAVSFFLLLKSGGQSNTHRHGGQYPTSGGATNITVNNYTIINDGKIKP